MIINSKYLVHSGVYYFYSENYFTTKIEKVYLKLFKDKIISKKHLDLYYFLNYYINLNRTSFIVNESKNFINFIKNNKLYYECSLIHNDKITLVCFYDVIYSKHKSPYIDIEYDVLLNKLLKDKIISNEQYFLEKL